MPLTAYITLAAAVWLVLAVIAGIWLAPRLFDPEKRAQRRAEAKRRSF